LSNSIRQIKEHGKNKKGGYMFQRLLPAIILLFFVNSIFVCTFKTLVEIDPDEAKNEDEVIAEIVLINGDTVKFDNPGGRYRPSKDSIVGVFDDTLYLEFEYDNISSVKVYKYLPNKNKTALAVAGGIVAGGLLFYLLYKLIEKELTDAITDSLW
jgi:hypothetical protein